MNENYPAYYDKLRDGMRRLSGDLPEVMSGFGRLHHHAVGEEGVLSGKQKELIALGIAVTVRCDGCIAFHVHDALRAGATRQEIVETVGVAVLMGGGPAVVYGVEALEAVEQFTHATAPAT